MAYQVVVIEDGAARAIRKLARDVQRRLSKKLSHPTRSAEAIARRLIDAGLDEDVKQAGSRVS